MIDPSMVGKPKYERRDREFYVTPEWCTKVLLEKETFNHNIWEPACGNGAISKVLMEKGYNVYSTDIHDNRKEFKEQNDVLDFIKNTQLVYNLDIITNPPYNKAVEFIELSLLQTLRYDGKIAMLLRNEFDSGKTRKHLFGECLAFHKKIILTERPKWIEDTEGNPRHNFAWFVWNWGRPFFTPPTIEYQ